MHDPETRALRRAALVLLGVSALRWGWTEARRPAADEPTDTVLPGLLAESRGAAEEAERRARPLAADERLDANRADAVELDRLPGVGPATARAIVAERERGTVYRRAEDLLSVAGIGPATLARMRPWLDFDDPPPARSASGSPGGPARVDVNRAGAADLETLPGIGPALAERILAARQERMFTSLDDLARVRGIGPATVERLRAHATVGR